MAEGEARWTLHRSLMACTTCETFAAPPGEPAVLDSSTASGLLELREGFGRQRELTRCEILAQVHDR